MAQLQNENIKLVRKLVLGCLLMFGFGFALVPIYDVFCEVTGLNGKVTRTGPAGPMQVDRSREVNLQLIAVNNEAMPWQFEPVTTTLTIHPGLTGQTAFLAYNPTGQNMIAQAVPSVAPAEAALPPAAQPQDAEAGIAHPGPARVSSAGWRGSCAG